MRNKYGPTPVSIFALFLILAGAAAVGAEEKDQRGSLWIDLYRGEPLSYGQVIDDLAGVRVIYLGESHRLQRHHDIQLQIFTDLAKRDVPLVLALEQLESYQQPILDKYNQGKITYEQLVKETKWEQRWGNYKQYRPLVEAARKAGAPILALNARSTTIRQVARGGGVEKLDAKLRKELPAEIDLKDPLYLKLLHMYMRVHMAATAERLRPMIEAQIARDEMMAATLCRFLRSPQGKGRTAVVICGAGHVSHGLGTPDRVRRRLPELKHRIILFSESGDVELSDAQKAMMRRITITHEQMRAINRPAADYLHATSRKPNDESHDE